MSEFTVHSIPGSPFGRAVMATLEEKGASYRLSVLAAPHANSSPGWHGWRARPSLQATTWERVSEMAKAA